MNKTMVSVKSYIAVACIVILVSLFYMQALGKLGPEFEPDENYYYQSCRIMTEKKDFTTPYYFEKKRFEKPILYYWLVSASFKFFGINWPAARAVSVLFSALFLLVLYNFCSSFYNERIAILSLLIAATFLCFFRYSRLLLPESTFLFFLFSFLCLFIKEDLMPSSKIRYILSYICLGLAILLKGPVAIILSFFTLFLYYKFTKRKFSWRDTYLAQGILIICIIVLPWFIRMIQLHGDEYLRHIFVREMKNRIFSAGSSGWLKNIRHFLKGLVQFIPVILYFYLPWSIFLPKVLYEEFKMQKSKRDNVSLFLLIYTVTIFVFFSLIYEKHRHYMLYMTPALAIFIAKYIAMKFTRINMKILGIFIFIATLLSLYSFGIMINKHSYTLDKMFSTGNYKFKQDDLMAVGSLSIHPYILEANVNKPVLKMCINMGNEIQTREETWNLLNRELFLSGSQKKRAFFLITEEQFSRTTFLPKVESTLRVVGEAYIVKKPDIKNAFQALLKRSGKLFWNSFREKVLFITNREI